MSDQQKHQPLKQIILTFLKSNFSKKNNIWRLIWFGIATIIVLILAIPLNIWAANKPEGFHSGNSGFIEITIVLNRGNGYGSGSEWPQGLVYFLKIFMSLIIFGLFLFLPCKWYYSLPLAASFVGGMFNVFDKAAHHDYVIDYFDFVFMNFVCNIPDIFITGGIFFTCGAFIVVFIIQIIQEKKQKNKKESTDQSKDIPPVTTN